MLQSNLRIVNFIKGNGIRSRKIIHDNRITLDMTDRFLRIFSKGYLTTVVYLTSALSNRLRHDRGAGMRCIVDHFSPCILMLIGIGKGNGKHGSTRTRSVQIDRWIFHSRFRTEVPINPLNGRIFHSPRPLGHEVVDII